MDRVIPSALGPIKAREFPRQPDIQLHDSLSISEVAIPLSEERTDRSVWGVVTWEDIDPRLDYFSVYVQGLTNAYKFVDQAGNYKKGDAPGTGRQFSTKTLQLNFWRPGDTVAQTEDEIRYGCRLEGNASEMKRILGIYGVKEPLDYVWLYR